MIEMELLKSFRDRPLYLWGAGQTGIGLSHALRRLGITPKGFIDKRKGPGFESRVGIPLYFPEEILGQGGGGPRPFVVSCSILHWDGIAASCREAGLESGADFISYERLCPFDYQVVVASACNLRCISCPIGNRKGDVKAGFMPLSDYEKVIDKIVKESPFAGIVQLYNWGEPFLNPDLAAIVAATNRRGVLCAISSNMNLTKDFEEVIRAKPAYLRLSMSGNEREYAISHTGGKWNLFLQNMEKLSELREKMHPELNVEVAYHVYRSTRADDIEQARKKCEELGFVFRPHLAALLPLDNVVDYMEGKDLSSQAVETIGMLEIPLQEAMERMVAQKGEACGYDRTLNIEYDLSVKHCGLWTRANENRIAENYLDVSLEEIVKRRRQNGFCTACKGRGLHRFCAIYTDEPVSEAPEQGLAENR